MQYEAVGSSRVGICEDCRYVPWSTERFGELGPSGDVENIGVALRVCILC